MSYQGVYFQEKTGKAQELTIQLAIRNKGILGFQQITFLAKFLITSGVLQNTGKCLTWRENSKLKDTVCALLTKQLPIGSGAIRTHISAPSTK